MYLLLLLCNNKTNAQTAPQFFKGIEHVIVIGVDAMNPDGIRKAHTPVMHQLMQTGAVKWNVRTVLWQENIVFTQSADGSKLFVDGKEIVNHDGDHGVIERTGSAELSAGRHRSSVEYYNGGGSFWLDALYMGPGVPKQIIPANKLSLSAQ